MSKKLEDTKRKELHSLVQGHPKRKVVFLLHQLSGASFVSGKVIVVNSLPILPSTWQMSCKYLLNLKSWTYWKRRSKHSGPLLNKPKNRGLLWYPIQNAPPHENHHKTTNFSLCNYLMTFPLKPHIEIKK